MPMISPKDCLAVLTAAKGDFLDIMGKLLADKDLTLEKAEAGLVLYYLEAVVILRHLQRPGVVENMTVSIMVVFSMSLLHMDSVVLLLC